MPQHAPLTPEEFQTVYQRAIKQAPADLSQAEFDDYVAQQAQHEEAAKAGSVAPGASDGLSFSPSGIFGGFLKGAKGLAHGAFQAVEHPWSTAKDLIDNQVGQFGKAAENFKQGRYSEAAGHGAAGMLPLMGPAAADLGERTAETGDLGNALGEGSLMALLASPSAMKPALTTAARAVPAVGRGIAAVGRGAEAVGTRASEGGLGHTGELGGALMLSHGNPMGLAMMAAPATARFLGRGAQRMGNSMASLTGAPSEWITSAPAGPSHAELNAMGAKRYASGKAQQDAAARASGMDRSFNDIETSTDLDFLEHGGLAPERGSGVAPTPPKTYGMPVDKQQLSEAHLDDLVRHKYGGTQGAFNQAMERAVRGEPTPPSPSMDSLMDLPQSWQQFAGPEAELAAVRRNQTGRW